MHKLNDSIVRNYTKDIEPFLKKNPRISKQKQLAIYSEGYCLRLGGAVRADYPTLIYYLGEKKANRLIADFVEKNNSLFYSLDFYPFKFAYFLQGNKVDEPAKELALLESKIAEIFLLPDSEPLAPQDLLTLSESQLDEFRFRPRTASVMFRFSYDVERFIQEFRRGEKPKKPEKRENYLFVVRHENSVKRHYLLAEEYQLLKMLFEGHSVDDAITEMNSEIASEMLPQYLQKWLMNGFLLGLQNN
jgi:hypothetical protein